MLRVAQREIYVLTNQGLSLQFSLMSKCIVLVNSSFICLVYIGYSEMIFSNGKGSSVCNGYFLWVFLICLDQLESIIDQ